MKSYDGCRGANSRPTAWQKLPGSLRILLSPQWARCKFRRHLALPNRTAMDMSGHQRTQLLHLLHVLHAVLGGKSLPAVRRTPWAATRILSFPKGLICKHSAPHE